MKEQENMKEFIIVYQGTTSYCDVYLEYSSVKAIDLKDARRVFRKQYTNPNSIRILAIGESLWNRRKRS